MINIKYIVEQITFLLCLASELDSGLSDHFLTGALDWNNFSHGVKILHGTRFRKRDWILMVQIRIRGLAQLALFGQHHNTKIYL